MRTTLTALVLTAAGVAGMSTALAVAAPGDGRSPISAEEMQARRAEAFSAADANGDGRIDIEEFESFQPPRAHRPPPPHGGRPAPMGPHGESPAEWDAEIFAALDANGDGVLTVEEFSTAKERSIRRKMRKDAAFEQMDSNESGYLEPDEFPPSRMGKLDTNGDGQNSPSEMRSGGRNPD